MADDSLVHALIGAVVTVVLSFTGLSPIIGGAVAGYLHKDDGLRVGAISGGIASIPLALILLVGATFLAFVPDLLAAGAGLLVVVLIFVILAGITVALSAIGGIVGVYLAEEL
jgi:hypothetical protein